MIREIVIYGDPILRTKGRKVTEVNDDIRQLVADMLETMQEAGGVGLAAQQVGKALQLTVIDVSQAENRPSRMWINGEEVDPNDHMPLVLLNPELTLSRETEIGPEGCLVGNGGNKRNLTEVAKAPARCQCSHSVNPA